MQLKICEIFYSIQGESSFAGQPCVFIRTTGCNLRCAWCDTRYAFAEGGLMNINDILKRIDEYDCDLIELTGGEPMVQSEAACFLMRDLISRNKRVLLETNGSLPLDNVPEKVHRIIDLKPPASGTLHDEKIWLHYAESWRNTDEIKCVIANREDFDWCIQKLHQYNAFGRVIIHFSPVWGSVDLPELAQWICDSHLPIRLNLQIHKVIWHPDARGV